MFILRKPGKGGFGNANHDRKDNHSNVNSWIFLFPCG